VNRLPMRTAEERIQFCDSYFQAVSAELIYSAPEYREYKLPRDIDKELTDRPFFWMWAEKTNQTVEPTTLRLAFDETAQVRENGRLKRIAEEESAKRVMTDIERMFFRAPTAEFVNLGSFRLEKIYESVARKGRFACVQPADMLNDTPLLPWLSMNGVISYRCDSIQQSWFSMGICLQTGQVISSFYDVLSKTPMRPAEPKRIMCWAKVTLKESIMQLRNAIQNVAISGPQDWAKEAHVRVQHELRQLNTYYNSILPDLSPDERELVEIEHARKSKELLERSQPVTEISVLQYALVGLPDSPTQTNERKRGGGTKTNMRTLSNACPT